MCGNGGIHAQAYGYAHDRFPLSPLLPFLMPPTPSEEAQDMLMDAVCVDDDEAAIAGINAALSLGADFTSHGVAPLWRATLRRTTRVLEHLLAQGATLRAEMETGNPDTALHQAAGDGRIDMLTVLLAHGGRDLFDAFDLLYGTPLATAAHEGRIDVVRILLDHGASIDFLGKDHHMEDTPLAHAIMGGHVEVATFLLSRGANPDVPGWMQYTPRMRAKDAGPEFERLFDGK